jgi:hypothetical protein
MSPSGIAWHVTEQVTRLLTAELAASMCVGKSADQFVFPLRTGCRMESL